MSNELSVSRVIDILDGRPGPRPSFPSVCIFMKKELMVPSFVTFWFNKASSRWIIERHTSSLLGDCIWRVLGNGGN